MILKGRLDKTVGPFLVALSAVFWGTGSAVRYTLTDKLSSTTIVFAEYIVGFVFAVPIVLKNYRQLFSFGKKHWFSLLFVSFGGGAVAKLLFTMSFTLTNPTVTILAQQVQPLIAILMASIILKERISKRKRFWIVAITAMAAVYLVSFGDANFGPALVDIANPATYLTPFTHLGEASVLGLGYALLAAFFWGGSTIFGRIMLEKVSFKLLSALRFFFATIFLFPIAIALNIFPALLSLSASQIILIVYLGLIAGFLSLFIYYAGLRSTKASVATLCELVFPVSAALINWIFLGFFLTLTQLVGATVLLIAIVFLSLENAKT